MSDTGGSPPLPARFYPPGGDAHGHPATLVWRAGRLIVSPADGAPQAVPAAALRIAARGFNGSQWAISWHAADGEQLLIVADAHIAPLREALPALFAGGVQARASGTRRFVVGIALLAAIPLLFAGAVLLSVEPLAERVVDHIPPEVERQIGAAVLARTRADSRMIDHGPAFDALQAIGRRLTRPGETLQLYLAERADVNAFAAPGGIVVVFSGLMVRAGSAEEVAGVLAHEIAHVELRHSIRQLVKAAGLRVIVSALAGDYSALGGWTARLGELKFSRDAEREADARALQRLADARIDAQGMLRFFGTLTASETTSPMVLSTHPATAERIDSLQKAIAAHPAAASEPLGIAWRPVVQSLGGPPDRP